MKSFAVVHKRSGNKVAIFSALTIEAARAVMIKRKYSPVWFEVVEIETPTFITVNLP